MQGKKELKNAAAWLRAEDPKLLYYISIAAILAVVAAGFLVLQSGRGGGLQGCEGILLQSYKDSCIRTLAYSTSNASLCGMLSVGQSDACIAYIAQSTSNAVLCGQLSQDSDYQACVFGIANQSDEYALCQRLNASMQGMCVTVLAVRESQPQACAGIANGSAAQVCADASLLSSATHLANPAACNAVSNDANATFTGKVAYYSGIYASQAQGSTLNGTAGLAQQVSSPLNIVQFISGATYSPRDLCYLYMATRFSSQQYCNDVSNATVANVCLESIPAVQASAPHNSTSVNGTAGMNATELRSNYTALESGLCGKLSLTAAQCESLFHLYNAVSTKNLTACAVLNGTAQYQCYSAVARTYQNATICGYITNATVNNACVEQVSYNSTT